MSGHRCHAENCERLVKPELLMCLRHWNMVPRELKLRVWQTYRPGQCDGIGGRPSAEYFEASRAAIAAVKAKEVGNV